MYAEVPTRREVLSMILVEWMTRESDILNLVHVCIRGYMYHRVGVTGGDKSIVVTVQSAEISPPL
jgi:hypothetical protein